MHITLNARLPLQNECKVIWIGDLPELSGVPQIETQIIQVELLLIEFEMYQLFQVHQSFE
jgi:hypothetical protein